MNDKKNPDKRTDTNDVNDNLKNVDQNDGGYGRGTGYDDDDALKQLDKDNKE